MITAFPGAYSLIGGKGERERTRLNDNMRHELKHTGIAQRRVLLIYQAEGNGSEVYTHKHILISFFKTQKVDGFQKGEPII